MVSPPSGTSRAGFLCPAGVAVGVDWVLEMPVVFNDVLEPPGMLPKRVCDDEGGRSELLNS